MNNQILTLASGMTGDISTCKIETSQIISARPSLFIEEIVTFAVNNCTGEVIQGSTYRCTGALGLIVCFLLVVLFIQLAWVVSRLDKESK